MFKKKCSRVQMTLTKLKFAFYPLVSHFYVIKFEKLPVNIPCYSLPPHSMCKMTPVLAGWPEVKKKAQMFPSVLLLMNLNTRK